MEVLFVSPKITINDLDKANKFFCGCMSEIKKYLLEYSVIEDLKQISQAISKINKNTLLIIFNNDSGEYLNEVIKLIDSANKNNTDIWPVALNGKFRAPMNRLDTKQSYDVFEQLRCRNLNEGYLETIGMVFARKIISKVLPTFYSDNNLLFVSHRRLDGEVIAANFCDQLSIQVGNYRSFRDITSVDVGQAAQDVIDSVLGQSDVLIFIHTERSAESDWIKKELVYAILNNIPIIWIRVDDAEISKLPLKPSDNPHIECKSEDFIDKNKLIKIIDNVLQKSFELIMLSSTNVYDRINTFKGFCESTNIELIEEDKRELIYKLVSPRKGFTYPQRSINQYIQYFGRRYNKDDSDKMLKFLENKIYNGNKLYDSAILLSDKVKVRKINEDLVFDNYEGFCSTWDKYTNNKNNNNKQEIIISGSFPGCDEIYKHSLYDAVNIFSKEILKSGLMLTFGSHPTFQNIIFEIGKKFRPNDYKKAINMFISKFFKDKYDVSDLKMNAKVTETDEIQDDLLKSLTEMRKKMINRHNVNALICLGGIIRNGDKTQGIDEEIKMARANDIPVFLVGSVGGRSAQLASEYMKTGDWSGLNKESSLLNKQLAMDLDYRYLANKVINIIKNNN